MRGVLRVMGLLLAGVLAGGVQAQALENENLLQTMPPGFKVGSRQSNAAEIMQEMVPDKESVEDWTRMITTQIFFHKGAWPPSSFLLFMRDRFSTACPGLPHSEVTNTAANGYPMSSLLLECPTNPATGKPENVYFRAIQGQDSFYVVQIAFRRPLSAGDRAFAEKYMGSINVCDTRTPDHPCPDMTKGFTPTPLPPVEK